MNLQSRYWALVPAAGVGRRMGSDIPKQYLPLDGATVIGHTITRLCAHPLIAGVVVALSPEDGYWDQLRFGTDKPVIRVDGGAERCHSVLNGLDHLAGIAADDDWVLVHDAARPCIRGGDLDRLIEQAGAHEVGGILAVPAHDTMKRANEAGEIAHTEDRNGLWHAFTPQMFRLGALREALSAALERGDLVTDEASAMELAGRHPLLVEGHGDNIKITRPEDLALAEFFLRRQREETGGCA